MELNIVTGRLLKGKYFTLRSNLYLGRGFSKIYNKEFVFASASKMANGHRYQYYAAFV